MRNIYPNSAFVFPAERGDHVSVPGLGRMFTHNYSDAFYHNIRCQDITFQTSLFAYPTPDTTFPKVTVLYNDSFAPAPITGTYLSNGCNYSLRLGVYGNVYSPYANPKIVITPNYINNWNPKNNLVSNLDEVPNNFDFVMSYYVPSNAPR